MTDSEGSVSTLFNSTSQIASFYMRENRLFWLRFITGKLELVFDVIIFYIQTSVIPYFLFEYCLFFNGL